VSSDTDDHGATTFSSSTHEGSGEEAPTIEQLESRLVGLADEISDVIASGPVAEREALHDYAVSLVRERLPVADSEGGVAPIATHPGRSQGNGAASVFGYGLLLIPVGLVLVPVFGLVGFALLLVGVVLASIGLVSGLVGRVKPGAARQ